MNTLSRSEQRGPRPASMDGESPRLGVIGRLLWLGLHLLPKNAISRLAGRVASVRLPPLLQRLEIRLFARLAGVDLAEAAEPIEAYPSLQSFFIRALREGVRPIEGDEAVLVSPCDGTWGAAGTIDDGTLLQVKGRRYRVADLLGDSALAAAYEGGAFATFYLSPRDYHRFHTPTAGRIRRIDHWPGSLWPVNSIGLHGIDGLFAKNERICAYLELSEVVFDAVGAAPDVVETPTAPPTPGLAIVAVGATMVGSVRLEFDAMTTNEPGALAERRDLGAAAPIFARGECWGRFEFGSTLVLLMPPGSFTLEPKAVGTSLRLGERIGRRIDTRAVGPNRDV